MKDKTRLIIGSAIALIAVILAGSYLYEKYPPGQAREKTREVRFLSGNLQLQGTLYFPDKGAGRQPGIVLCHGSSKYGRRLALYAAMAHEFNALGYVVLCFDFRGYGQSQEPHPIRTFMDLDFVQDISAAIGCLTAVQGVDGNRIYVVGHSFGAGVALAAAVRDPRSRKTVSISPGRRTQELFFGPNAENPAYPAARMSQDMGISPPIADELINPHLIDYAAETLLRYPVHPPVLFIDGSREAAEDLAFLRRVAQEMTPPTAYITIQGADHYFGTSRNQQAQNPLVYDKAIVTDLVTRIDGWLRQP